jgi:hypothetical protein
MQTRQLKCLSEDLHVSFNPFCTSLVSPIVVVKGALDMPISQIRHVLDTSVEPISILNSLSKASPIFVDEFECVNSPNASLLAGEGIANSLELISIAQLDCRV